MSIDLRSDTVTRPTPEMLEAMYAAPVGDDVYGEDPSVNALQERLAETFGMEAGLFCPSGTMCNQIAIRVHTQPQDEVICDQYAHVYLYEGGGMMANSQVSVQLLHGDRMLLTANDIEAAIREDDPHYPRSALVCLENTANKGGGACYNMSDIAAISQMCRERGLSLHLDGARIFNALVATGQTARDYGRYFDTISCCLSKGLGAPVGSVLLGSKAMIYKARRVRKMLGGAMRQSGYLAAAGVYALDHHVDRLAEDHRRALELANILRELSWVEKVMPVETNIVGFKPDAQVADDRAVLDLLARQDILASSFGGGYVRMVTHLEIDDVAIQRVVAGLHSATLSHNP